jgi:toxin ParE1/3/4
MKLRVARSARADLDKIWNYLAKQQSVEAAQRVIESLTDRFSFLARYPGSGRNRPEFLEGVRGFPVGNYRIYYRQEAKGIVRILYVRHSARDESKLFGAR